jgi:hypothetical protein
MTTPAQSALTIFARVGYAARGLIFVLLGGFAAMAAVRAAAPFGLFQAMFREIEAKPARRKQLCGSAIETST